MKLVDLDYDLPDDLIAQVPAARRTDARLLVVERASGALHDSRIADLSEWLRPGDALALNETRVRPARLHLAKPSGGAVECLFVRPEPGGEWRVLARPGRAARPGRRLLSAGGDFEIEVTGANDDGTRRVRIVRGDLDAELKARGEIPLPPYIRRPVSSTDVERYQTVFARVDGAVAAPTAALHFSRDLLDGLERAGIRSARLVLHVGPGTFRPIAGDDPDDHVMDEEWFEVPESAAAELRAARERGSRIVAVGTTTVRALETTCDLHDGTIAAASGWTRKYIRPPYAFRAVDSLLTNFHLPRTTLLLLLAAFAGVDLVRAAYTHAVRERYRFYSYGDAMLVI